MKQTQIQLTGWKWWNDDIQYIQDGAKEAFAALVKALPSDIYANGFRLWGLEMTLTDADLTLNWTAGAVAFDGEIFLVDAGSIGRSSAISKSWKFVAVDAWGQTEYTGAGFLNTRNDRKATLVQTNNFFPQNYTRYDAPYLLGVISPKYRNENISGSDVIATDIVNGTVAGVLVSDDCQYRLSYKSLDITMAVNYTLSAVADYIDIMLPGGLVSSGYFVGMAMVNGKAHRVNIIEDDGAVRITNWPGDQFAATTLFISLSMRLEVK
jgi:hypothetical protein